MAIMHTFEYVRAKGQKIELFTDTKLLTQKSAIKYHCLDCSGGSVVEARNCIIPTCPLYPFRPFQKKGVKNTPVDVKEG